MSTITKEFTKEQLIARINQVTAINKYRISRDPDADGLAMDNELFAIALASLEAEPVAYSLIFRNMDGVLNDYVNANTTFSTIEKAQAYGRGGNYVRQNDGSLQWVSDPSLDPVVVPLFTAPPAPVSVPAEVGWEDVPEDITEDDMEVALAWAHGFNQCRSAMLKHSEPFIVTSDHRMMEMPQVEAINAVTAMLQGVEPVTTAYKLRDAVEIIRNSGIEIDAEKIFAERDALNTPDCWCRTCRPVTVTDMRFVVCPDCGNKRCPHANDHRNACTGSNEPGQDGSAYPAAPQQEA